MQYKTIRDIIKAAQEQESKRVAIVAAEEEATLQAVKEAVNENIIVPILLGNKEKILEIAQKIEFDVSNFEIIETASAIEAAQKAVSMVKNGGADLLMKGLISTSYLLKAVLNKQEGLNIGKLVSHVGIFELPTYHKLLCVTDAAINIAPKLKEKIDIIKNAVYVMNALGVEIPKIAVLAAVEKVNPEKMPVTEEGAILTKMSQRKQLGKCIVDGPLALDNAVSKKSAEIKGIKSDVAGDADILLADDIESGNVLYKSLTYLANGVNAGLVVGAAKPIILTSRSDSYETKMGSIALGCIASNF